MSCWSRARGARTDPGRAGAGTGDRFENESVGFGPHRGGASGREFSTFGNGRRKTRQNGARGVERAKTLYGNHKRSVLLAAAFAIVAIAAVRLISEHVPLARKSDLSGQPSKVALAGGSSGKPILIAPPTAPQIDRTPTASIASPPETSKANPSSVTAGPELSSTVAAALPASLHDAVVAGSPAAQYELAQRLFEGRGVPQDQQAAALWFERAASSGLAPAQFRLGTSLQQGRRGPARQRSRQALV